jgi:hypothetical protein
MRLLSLNLFASKSLQQLCHSTSRRDLQWAYVFAGFFPLTIGSSSGEGAILNPGVTLGGTATLTVESSLAFNSKATYHCGINTSRGRADAVVANGVAISGARFVANDNQSTSLTLGTLFTVIDNRAATPIAGIFANLPDGSTISVGSNTFQANYEGGDGNNLTLTVVP